MYTCNQCDTAWEGEPFRRAGRAASLQFCQPCSEENTSKALEAMRKKNEAIAARNQCLWCDERLTDNNRAPMKEEDHHNNICLDCDSRSPYRKQLEKWLTAVGVKKQSAIMEYLALPKRQERWEKERQRKRSVEQSTTGLPLVELSEWTEYQEFVKWKQMKEQSNGSQNNR